MFHELNILQSTSFPISCHDLKLSPNNLISIGTYKPRIKVHTLSDFSLKTERNIEHEPLKVEILNEDATKIAILCTDRIIELHAKFGSHSSYRIPSIGRNLQFNSISAELITQSDNAIYMFNLEEGRFKKPIECNDIKNMHFSTVNNILAIGAKDKIVLVDYRSMQFITEFKCNNVDAVQFNENGIKICYNEGASVVLKDLRMKEALYAVSCSDDVRVLRFNKESICALGNKGIDYVVNRDVKWNICESNVNAFDFDGNVFFLGCENGVVKIFHNGEIDSEPEWCRSLDLIASRIEK